MASGTVLATADEQHDDKEDDHDEGDEPKDLHPAWSARRWFAVRPPVVFGAGLGVRVAGWISHECPPLKRVTTAEFTRQYVDTDLTCLDSGRSVF
jgi:hypothetical protein